MTFEIRHEARTIDGRRIPHHPAKTGGYAGIYNAEGYGIANIDRLARIDGAGDLGFVHDHIVDNDDPRAHATTDAEWQSLACLMGAAPEMLSVLRNIMADLDCGEGLSVSEADVMRGSILAVLAKAEPTVRRRVRVAVEVEIDAEPGDTDTDLQRRAVEIVRDGEGTITSHDLIT